MPARSLKVLHVVQRYWPYQGGSERYMQDIGERLAAEGHQVEVWTTDAEDLELFWRPDRPRLQKLRDVHNGVAIRRFRVRHMPLQRFAAPALGRIPLAMADLLFRPPSPMVPDLFRARSGPVDVVHATSLPYNSLLLAALRIARRHRARFIVTPHLHCGEPGDDTVLRHYARPAQLWLLRQADAVVARTSIEAELLARRGIAVERLHVIGGWVDLNEVKPGDGEAFRAKHGLGDEAIVSYVGTRAFDKGTVHLVQAMRKLWEAGEKARLVMAGPSIKDFRTFFAGQPEEVQRRTLLLDYIPTAEKWDLYAASNIFAMPSRTDTFGIVFLEAWLHGLPVIGARAGGISAVIEEGKDGLLVPFGAVEKLTLSVRELLLNADQRRRMGEAGAAKTRSKFELGSLFPSALALYT